MESYMMRSEREHETRRMRRRIWFTLHVVAYVLFSLSYTLLFAPDPFLMAINSLLLTTIFVHAGWLYMVGLYDSSMHEVTRRVQLMLAELSPQPVPVLSDGETRLVEPCAAERDFWFRWHDLG